VSADDFVLVQGIRDTRGALERWSRDPAPVLRSWFAGSLLVSVGLLIAVWVVATFVTPDPTPILLPGISYEPDPYDVATVLARNGLVLALHATACVAGFIAGSSLRHEAARRTGFSRLVHEKAGPIAIALVVVATTFSLTTQAYVLGSAASSIAASAEIAPATLILTVLPHALLELVAVFLPLAAWLIASRNDEWQDLLAATFATVGLAIPMLVVAALIETYIWPHLLAAISPVLT
jgi:ABC-type dipeptide/oligopeptide/nickel transport system permease component